MGRGWLGYERERLTSLARRIADAADYYDGITSDEPLTQPAIATIRAISFELRTTWLPLIARICGDTSMTAWTGCGPGISAGWSAVEQPPEPGDPDAVREWWESLSEEQQLEYIAGAPALIGNLNGVPAWARDQANRSVLDADVERLEAEDAAGSLDADGAAVLANAQATQEAIIGAEQFVDPVTGLPVTVQLYIYEPAAYHGDGRAAIGLGDLDTADNVAVTVPGLGTEVTRIGTSVQQNIYTDAREQYPGGTVAVLNWVGYDAPSAVVPEGSGGLPDLVGEAMTDLSGVATMGKARDGADVLAEDVAGINAMRDEDVHLTVVGNSYGSTTAAIAADEFDLEADVLVLTGSPGAGEAETAAELSTGTDNTWVASASNDPVTYLGDTGGHDPLDVVEPIEVLSGTEFGLGRDPSEDEFGAQRVRAEWSERGDGSWTFDAHGHYYDVDSESNENIASIVMGHPEDVELAEHREKDEVNGLCDVLTLNVDAFPEDPEADRDVDADD
jgi:hypothetical protein